uniref:Ig-like domain-containing protein n=1 Tax=Neolamprologus brichardi TaxID=32507 RepID=A0A3Q4H3F5_NEOBR
KLVVAFAFCFLYCHFYVIRIPPPPTFFLSSYLYIKLHWYVSINGVTFCHVISMQIFKDLNKLLEVQYNSSVGKVVGYTKNGIKVADKLNGNFHKTSQQLSRNCLSFFQSTKKPYVWLRSVDAADSRRPSMLVCSAYNFYPKQIKLTWLRDGKQTTTDVTSTEELPNGNWLYQIHSYLEYTPTPEEKISCMVEHASLMKPMIYDWEPSPDSGRDKIAVGAAGLLLGLVFSVAGLIYYKKKSSGERFFLINIK